jgi:hypothetical protein
MNKLSAYWWLIGGTVLNTAFRYQPFSFSYIDERGMPHYSFLIAQAAAYAFFLGFAFKRPNRDMERWEYVAAFITGAAIISNALDEAAFDPITPGANEYVIVVAALIISLFSKMPSWTKKH